MVGQGIEEVEVVISVWHSLEVRLVGVQKVGGSNPLTLTLEVVMDKKTKHAKALKTLYDIVVAAERVSNKYGCNEAGEPSDWNEWVDLRRAIMEARYVLKRG